MVRLYVDKFTRGIYVRLGRWILSLCLLESWGLRVYDDSGCLGTRLLWWGHIGPFMFDIVWHKER